jgi:hypothetical protein
LHKAGLQDTHIRKDPDFDWLNNVTSTISSAFKSINWGKEYEHFLETAELLVSDASFTEPVYTTSPCFFSETRFANHCARVYKAFRKDYPALVTTLEDTQIKNAGGNSKEREKAHEASKLKSSIVNKKFCLHLSGLSDIYSLFGHAVNVLQTVNMLPHEKYDKFIAIINDLVNMVSSISDHSLCRQNPDEKCMWPDFHKDVTELKNT